MANRDFIQQSQVNNKANIFSQLENNRSKNTDIGFYAYLSKARDCEEFKLLILKKIHRMGFDHFSFVRLNNSDCDPGLLTTIPKDLSNNYYKERLGEYDMILSYATLNTKPIYRSTIDRYAFLDTPLKTPASIANENIHHLNKAFDLYDYYCVFSERQNKLGNSMLSVSAKGVDPIDFRRKIFGNETTLQLLCEAIEYIAIKKFPKEFLSSHENYSVEISSRPLEVLDTLANSDMSITGVAKKLNISHATANQHLINARKAFNANTNVGAIKQAILLKLIDYKK